MALAAGCSNGRGPSPLGPPAEGGGASGAALGPQEETEPDPWAGARGRMVDRDIAGRGVRDPVVLEAMRRVPRHRFVPEGLRQQAYADHPLPIGMGQTISQPYIVALMTELAELDSDDRVLEIGTGSGYQAAILAEIVDQVYTIEIVEPLGRRAAALLQELRYDNIEARIGDGYRGWPEVAPFDAIVVTAAPPEVPQPLLDQLAVGGRMVIPVGTHYQELRVFRRELDGIRERRSIPVRFVPMTGEAQDNP